MLKLQFTDDDTVEVGIDEAGRGCLMGRLYAGAVVLPGDAECFYDHGAALNRIKDSKKLSKRQREILFDYVNEIAIDRGVGWVSAQEIDTMNVLRADMLAMRRACRELVTPVGRLLVDGDQWEPVDEFAEIPFHRIVGGDASYLAIAAASILAKVSHDRYVEELCSTNPEWNERYSLLTNQGYGTALHIEGIKKWGPSPEHRMSFAPMKGGCVL